MSGQLLALLSLIPACLALTTGKLPASLITELDSPPFAKDASYFPVHNATFYVNPNGTLAEHASALTATADEWVNPFPMPKCFGLDLEEATIDQMQEWMHKGKLTSRQLTSCYLNRVDQLQEYVNAVMEINPDVLKIASMMDEERKDGKVRGPLHGIPFIVKDNIASQDKMETTSGSLALLGSKVPRDSHVVKLLRDTGAVLMGKTGMDEWAWYRNTVVSNGYSSRGGQVRNAFNLTSSPAGSSSGSGQVITANMAAFSLGTETDGSIMGPARRSGIIGIKPTVGLTSRAGVIPQSLHQDTVGVHARTFKDAVLGLQGIVGPDKRDNYTDAQIGKTPKNNDYTQFLRKKDSLKGVTLGLPWTSLWNTVDPDFDGLEGLLQVIKELEEAGARIINGTEIGHMDVLSGWLPEGVDYLDTISYRVDIDFYNDVESYLSELANTNIKTIEDVIAYGRDNSGTMGGYPGVVPGFPTGQDGLENCVFVGGAMNDTYLQTNARLIRYSREEGIDAALMFNGTKVDALLAPSAGSSTTPAAAAGYPMINIPVGINPSKIPYGIAVMGSAFSEPDLIRVGSAIDDLVQGRHVPQFYEYWSKNVPIADS